MKTSKKINDMKWNNNRKTIFQDKISTSRTTIECKWIKIEKVTSIVL